MEVKNGCISNSPYKNPDPLPIEEYDWEGSNPIRKE